MDGIVILLGAANARDGNLSSIAIERCERAISEYRNNLGFKILPTGGYGPHFNVAEKPHAFYAKQYLVTHGVPEEDILEFVVSSNTREDAQLSRPIVEKHRVKRVIVVTSDYHVRRARHIFENEFHGIEVTFSGSHTNLSHDELDALMRHEEQAILSSSVSFRAAKRGEESLRGTEIPRAPSGRSE